MTTVESALLAFDKEWVKAQSFTPQTSYRRTLRLLRLYLETHPPALDQPVTDLRPETLTGFVLWHRQHALADDAEGTRKIAVHVARLGEFLRERYGLAELAISRDVLRALVPDEVA